MSMWTMTGCGDIGFTNGDGANFGSLMKIPFAMSTFVPPCNDQSKRAILVAFLFQCTLPVLNKLCGLSVIKSVMSSIEVLNQGHLFCCFWEVIWSGQHIGIYLNMS